MQLFGGEHARPGRCSARLAPNNCGVDKPCDEAFSSARVSREARLTAPEAGALPFPTALLEFQSRHHLFDAQFGFAPPIRTFA